MLDQERRYELRLERLKLWIWIYFWLLIFEGVLRKWVFPDLSGPLLLIRDPVALMIYYRAYRCGKFSMKAMWPFAILAGGMVLLACIQVIAGIGQLFIVLFGLRSYLLHFPLMVVIASTLDDEDLYKIGRWLMLLSLPMMLLVMAQYNADSSSWLNAGAGEGARQIASVNGRIRPAGTFSYGIGMQSLVVLTAAFLTDALMHRRKYPSFLVGYCVLAVIGMVPLLGSRGVLLDLAALVILTLLSGLSHGARLLGLAKLIPVLLLGALMAVQFSFFNEAIETMKLRWDRAAQAEGNFQEMLSRRVWGVFESAGEISSMAPLLGSGIGVGSRLASVTEGDERQFMAGESEWERVVVEFGPIFAFLFLGGRVALAVYLALEAFQALRRGSVLGWLLLPLALPLMIFGVMEQPTNLGFMVFGSGLCLAAARRSKEPSWETAMYAEPSVAV